MAFSLLYGMHLKINNAKYILKIDNEQKSYLTVLEHCGGFNMSSKGLGI